MISPHTHTLTRTIPLLPHACVDTHTHAVFHSHKPHSQALSATYVHFYTARLLHDSCTHIILPLHNFFLQLKRLAPVLLTTMRLTESLTGPALPTPLVCLLSVSWTTFNWSPVSVSIFKTTPLIFHTSTRVRHGCPALSR